MAEPETKSARDARRMHNAYDRQNRRKKQDGPKIDSASENEFRYAHDSNHYNAQHASTKESTIANDAAPCGEITSVATSEPEPRVENYAADGERADNTVSVSQETEDTALHHVRKDETPEPFTQPHSAPWGEPAAVASTNANDSSFKARWARIEAGARRMQRLKEKKKEIKAELLRRLEKYNDGESKSAHAENEEVVTGATYEPSNSDSSAEGQFDVQSQALHAAKGAQDREDAKRDEREHRAKAQAERCEMYERLWQRFKDAPATLSNGTGQLIDTCARATRHALDTFHRGLQEVEHKVKENKELLDKLEKELEEILQPLRALPKPMVKSIFREVLGIRLKTTFDVTCEVAGWILSFPAEYLPSTKKRREHEAFLQEQSDIYEEDLRNAGAARSNPLPMQKPIKTVEEPEHKRHCLTCGNEPHPDRACPYPANKFNLDNEDQHPRGQLVYLPACNPIGAYYREALISICRKDLSKLGKIRQLKNGSLLLLAIFEIIPNRERCRYSGLFANIEGAVYTVFNVFDIETAPLDQSFAMRYPDNRPPPIADDDNVDSLVRTYILSRVPSLEQRLTVTAPQKVAGRAAPDTPTNPPSVANAAQHNVPTSNPAQQSTQVHEAPRVDASSPELSNEELSFAEDMDTDESMIEAPIAEASYAEILMTDVSDDDLAPHAASSFPSSKTTVVPPATSPSISSHVPQVVGSRLPVVSSAATGVLLHPGTHSSAFTDVVGHPAPAESSQVPQVLGNRSLSQVSGAATALPPPSIPQSASAYNTAGRAVPRPSPWNTTVVQQKRADFIKLELAKLDAAEQGLVNTDPIQTVWDEYRKRIKGALLKLVGYGGKDGKQAATQWLNGADATGKFPTRREHWGGWIKDDFGRRMNL